VNFPGWITARLREKGIAFEREVPGRLAFFVEGNLLAAAQEIVALSTLSQPETHTGDG
jgi:DNA polymerase III delta subunit